jgi:hypothetical protein
MNVALIGGRSRFRGFDRPGRSGCAREIVVANRSRLPPANVHQQQSLAE